ncbi:hypothetical protein OHA98_12920 [Streptomyces sp. NBC_00654]|uniref:hypothetical protein n=1 Tax=Streptomyces sp. NBC_00654 TaxID=2975799 RepID=UPI00224D5F70|nr:hypothetical protein [Streptomyces sp. NBC_00654]MCX4965727.1 hypothetical protein [Streptomyces sp. NBC_00654]
MLQQNTTKRLGYWLLLLHQQFDASTGRSLAGQKLTRRQWQVLHALSIKVDSVAGIDAAFAPFLVADGVDSYQSVVDEFDVRGWVTVTEETVTLTESGEAAHERAELVVNAHAAESLGGISEAEFLAANEVLARIAENLDKK